MNNPKIVYVTVSSIKDAQDIAKACVSNKLAACVNILSQMQSVYCWNDEIVQNQEVAMFIKTSSGMVPELITFIKGLHPAQCPCIVAMDITDGNKDYLDWVETESTKNK